MTDREIGDQIPGALAVIELYGHWPSFHDSEVTELTLSRLGSSCLRNHTFAMTSRLDASGHYVCEKHAIVTFLFQEVFELDLVGFNNQNVLSGLIVRKVDEGYRVELGGCYGPEGSICARELRVEFELGVPAGSVYAEVRS